MNNQIMTDKDFAEFTANNVVYGSLKESAGDYLIRKKSTEVSVLGRYTEDGKKVWKPVTDKKAVCEGATASAIVDALQLNRTMKAQVPAGWESIAVGTTLWYQINEKGYGSILAKQVTEAEAEALLAETVN